MNILFFSSKVLKENGKLRVDVGMVRPPKWIGGTTLRSGEEGMCTHRNQTKLPLWQKVSKLFSMSFVCSWEWIKFLEGPCEEWRQEPSEFLMAPLSEGMPFFQLFGLDLRALNISLFFVFPLPCPPPFPLPPFEKLRYSYF